MTREELVVSNHAEQINTQGGALIKGPVITNGGDFVGRDQIINIINQAVSAVEEAKKARGRRC